jgi:hypothetical protein
LIVSFVEFLITKICIQLVRKRVLQLFK